MGVFMIKRIIEFFGNSAERKASDFLANDEYFSLVDFPEGHSLSKESFVKRI